MRLTGGVVQRSAPLRGCGGDQNLLRGGDARFVEKELPPLQAGRGFELVGVDGGHRSAELDESVEMTVEPAASDHIPARRIEFGTAAAGQKRRGEQDARAVSCTHFPRHAGGPDLRTAQAQNVVFKGEFRPQFPGDIEHGADIENVRHVSQHRLLVGKQQRRNHRQSRVLVAGNRHGAADPGSSLHHQTPHESSLFTLHCFSANYRTPGAKMQPRRSRFPQIGKT